MIAEALRLSIVVALLATVFVAIVGTALGWWLARSRFPGRGWIDGLLQLPLVLPPTVTGYYLLVLLGRRGLLGTSIPFSWAACVVAASVMALPLMIRAARVAFEELDPRQQLAAATLGAGPLRSFLTVSLPLARRGLLAGVVLSFARALGEFGATLMLAGNIPGRTQTLPLAIYEAVMIGDDRTAILLSLLLTALSMVVLLLATRFGGRR